MPLYDSYAAVAWLKPMAIFPAWIICALATDPGVDSAVISTSGTASFKALAKAPPKM